MLIFFCWDFEVSAWLRFWRWKLIKFCVWTCDMTHQVTLVSWTQPLGPLYLWHCFHFAAPLLRTRGLIFWSWIFIDAMSCNFIYHQPSDSVINSPCSVYIILVNFTLGWLGQTGSRRGNCVSRLGFDPQQCEFVFRWDSRNHINHMGQFLQVGKNGRLMSFFL